jgi:hypothetical protein
MIGRIKRLPGDVQDFLESLEKLHSCKKSTGGPAFAAIFSLTLLLLQIV